MPQAGTAFQRLVLYCLHQAVQLAGTPADLDLTVADDGDARRVVAAIFKPPQPFDDDRDGLLIADVSDDSAHKISSEKGRANWQFARISRKAALKESRQTASLPYPPAALFIYFWASP